MNHPAASLPDASHAAERGTWAVAALTAVTMAVEITAGWWFNSMALLADGWHMGTHAAAIGLSALAYGWARRYRDDPRFAFGAWKIEVLAAFASAVALFLAALGIAAGSVERLVLPQPIRYGEAIGVAVIGLVVNLVCAWILGRHHDGPEAAGGRDGHHHHGHDAAHHHHAQPAAHAGPDLNLRSAYLHVVADAATSALAIVALCGGLWLGWAWLDPVIGLVGALMVARWGVLLLRDTSRVLLDREMDHPLVADVRRALADDAPWGSRTQLVRLHALRTGRADWALIVQLASTDPGLSAERVRRYLGRWPALKQVTIQIDRG